MDRSVWVTIIVALISSGAVGTFITSVFNYRSRKDAQKQEARQNDKFQKASLRLLIQDQLDRAMQHEIEKGNTTVAKHKHIQEMYDTYKGLDGNGDMEWLKEKYDELPIA